MPGSRHLYPDFHRGVSSCSDSFTLVQCRSFQGGGQQTVGPPPAPQCAQPSEETSWPWPAKDSAPSDLITSCAFSALQPWGTGVNVAPALTHSEKSACCSLFIYHPLLCLSSPFSSPSSTPSRTSFIIPACSFFSPHPCILLEMWIKVTTEAAGMTESACLQGHLSSFSCPPPHLSWSLLAAAAT